METSDFVNRHLEQIEIKKQKALKLFEDKMKEHKDKAEDLLLKYSILNEGHNHLVKQCALIAIDEMIEQNGELYLAGINEKYYREKNAYLFGVKTEIELL